MAEHRDIDYVGILRIDDDTGDGLGTLQTHLREGLAGISRFIDAVAKAGTLSIVGLAGTDPDDVGI